jgi:hypothetical protein
LWLRLEAASHSALHPLAELASEGEALEDADEHEDGDDDEYD